MRKPVIIFIAIILLAGLILSGCSSEETETATTTVTSTATATTTATATATTTATATVTATKEAPSEILFGQAISFSGVYAGNANFLEVPNLKTWEHDVNAEGGIYVAEYGKKIPVRLIQYDDKSDIETMIKLVKKLITEDKVDFIFPPHSSAMHAAAIPLINSYKIPFPVFSAIVSPEDLADMGKYPYRFVIFPDLYKMNDPIIQVAKENGVKTMAVIYVQDQMGIVYNGPMKDMLAEAGIETVLNKSYPLGATDISTLLKEIKTLNPDGLVAFTYPSDALLLTEQSKIIGLNPKYFFVGIGGGMPMYRDKFGAETIEGVVSWGGWSPSLNAHTQAYWDNYKEINGFTPDYYSGHWAYAYAEVMGQAIEKAGSLDREKVRDALMTETFKGTVMVVDVKFENYMNPNLYSYVGQWQDGVLEALWPKDVRKVDVIYPKPEW